MAVRIEGRAAELRWGYYVAATLGAWTVHDQVLTATVTEADPFRIAQRPLVFVPPRGGTWALLEVTVGPHELRATVGPRQ